MNLHGRVALVTGAANGIGRAIALSLASYGAQVALADVVKAEESERLIEEMGGKAFSVHLDVTDTQSINAVSYTHLDVYKRQAHSWAMKRM